MGRLRQPMRWPVTLVATCAVASSACGGSNPDALFQARDAAAENSLVDISSSDADPPLPEQSVDAGGGHDVATDSAAVLDAEVRDATMLAADASGALDASSALDASGARDSSGALDSSGARDVDALSDDEHALDQDALVRDGAATDASFDRAGDGDLLDASTERSPADAFDAPPDQESSDGTSCDDRDPCAGIQGGRCGSDSVCTPTFMVVRVGDGSEPAANRSVPVRVERRFLNDSAALVVEPGNPVVMPVTASGDNLPFSLSALAAGEGALSLSADGRYATLAGYLAPPGTPGVRSTANRVVARIDRHDQVDTSTMVTMGLYGDNVRSAASLDGTQFWVAGSGNFDSSGIYYIGHGDFGGRAIMANAVDIRAVNVFGSQLYATSGRTLLAVGSSASDALGQLSTALLPGNWDPYSFALIDHDQAIPGPDTVYVADDQPLENGNGAIRKWTRGASGGWQLAASFGSRRFVGMRGVAALAHGSTVTVVATTSEATENHIVSFIDDGSSQASLTVLADAPVNTAFRGIAFAP
jgi:hypothetical protein